MMFTRYLLFAFFSCLLLANSLAQENSPLKSPANQETSLLQAAIPAKEKYDHQIYELRMKYKKDIESATVEYLMRIDEQIKLETARGDLEKILALKTEKDRISQEKPATEKNVHKMILAMRGTYELKLKTQLANFERSAKTARSEFLTDLDSVIREETKANRLEAAIAIRDAKKALEGMGVAAPEDKPLTALNKPSAETTDKQPSLAKGIESPSPKSTTNVPARGTSSNSNFATWDAIIAKQAEVEVLNIGPIALSPDAEKQSFTKIPELFTSRKAIIYDRMQDKLAGIAKIKVLSDGYLLIACSYVTQGGGGEWETTRWKEADFVKNGWRKILPQEVGGELLRGKDRTQILFLKEVKKGDDLTLRCNKYDPPFVISFEKTAAK